MVRTRSDLGCPLVASTSDVYESFTFSLHVDEPWKISQDNPAFEEGVDESIAGDAGDVVAIVEDAMQRLFDLEADWDGEGSPVFDEITVKAASDFVYELSFQGNGESLTKEVEILPASGGSVDLHWQTPHFELLIVFNADGSSSFYGDNCNGERSIQGEQRPDPEEIAHWMGGLDA